MPALGSAVDLFYAYRFLRLLTTDWKDFEAYDLGIIDQDGTLLKKKKDLEGREEKDAYTYYHRLVWNFKRILEKIPFMKNKIARYATALFLIKEAHEDKMSDTRVLEEEFYKYLRDNNLLDKSLNEQFTETVLMQIESESFKPGTYLLEDSGEQIVITEELAPIDYVMNVPIFRYNGETFSYGNIQRLSTED